MTSTLTALEAPLAPEIVTPGFVEQQQSLNQPFEFEVRFIPNTLPIQRSYGPSPMLINKGRKTNVIADQAFNSLSLISAYMGEDAVQAVIIDPEQPTRQVTRFQGDRQLSSTISDRGTETNAPDEFITSELYQQTFRSPHSIYLNQVENTTAYHTLETTPSQIEAHQVTAIYLSPQDPDYFKAGTRPVALYQYHLQLVRLEKN